MDLELFGLGIGLCVRRYGVTPLKGNSALRPEELVHWAASTSDVAI
jgi:ribosomal protein S12